MSKAKKKVKMRTWHGYCIVWTQNPHGTQEAITPASSHVPQLWRPGYRIARVEVREIVTKRSKG